MTTPNIPHRFEFEVEVPGTPEQVWQAIATAEGISSWMMPTELEPRVGGAVTFHMGPEASSTGHVTAYEPARRIEYDEDWASLMGHPGADVTPLVTEFLVEARSGGTCVVRVVTSAFGTGADWENEFFEEMNNGWAPVLDNLRLYLTNFAGQSATTMFAGTEFGAMAPQAATAALRDALGISGQVGEAVTVRGLRGHVQRSIGHHLLITLDEPMSGMLSFFAFGAEGGSGVHMAGYLFADDAAAYVERERAAWQELLEATASRASVDAST
jgi:uncharacterized protein YndB with AHSA1/START domain